MSQSHLPPEEPLPVFRGAAPGGTGRIPEPRAPAEEIRPPRRRAKRRNRGLSADLYGWLQALTFALAFILIFFTFFGRVIGVDGHSMDPTLNDRDMLFLQCIAYEPKQGDVVVLHKDFGDVETPIVKRVIAVGGQTVDIDYSTGTVYVDGQPLEEDYIMEPMVRPESPYLQGTYWEVPEGSVFVMGTTGTTPPTAGTAAWARWTPGMCWGGPSAPFSPSSTSAWWNKEVRPCDWTNG